MLLNLRHSQRMGDKVPAPLHEYIDQSTVVKSRAYTQANGRFALFEIVYGSTITLLVLFSGLMPALADWLIRLGVLNAHLFVVFLLALFGMIGLANLPLSLYQTFSIETRFGFNRQTWQTWLFDQAKGLILSLAIGVPILYGIYGFMSFAGAAWWLWLFAFLVVVQAFLLWLYPAVIAPLFNTFIPLPEGELKARLNALADETGFKNRGLYVMDASRRSGHSNAYFTGLFRPRIVLFDTLVATMTVEEAAAVLAHEIGHYKGRHILWRLMGSLVSMLITLFVLSKLIVWPPLFHAFGFAAPSYHAAIALLALGSGAFTYFFQPFTAWLSRRNEYQADRFSVRFAHAPGALKTALIRLGGQNLSNPTPHPFYSLWTYSHPTLLERIAAIDAQSHTS
jgi:STE24 endopeptidase